MSGSSYSLRWLLVLAIVGVSCRPVSMPPPVRHDTSVERVWPSPPGVPRVRYVGAAKRPRDLGLELSVWKRVVEFLAGEREQWFVRPTGIAANGPRIYVADPGAQALWILDTETGRWRIVHDAGEYPLLSPVAVAAGRDGRVYVADSYLARIFVFDSDGKMTGSVTSPRFRRPAGVAYDDGRDRVYVADSASHCVWIFDGDGEPTGAIGRRGTGDGEFNFPTHVAVDASGDLYVTDALNFRLQIFGVDGGFLGGFGRHGDYPGDLASPKGVAVDSEGHVYVVDALFDAVQIFDRDGRYLLAFGERGLEAGQFWLPGGLFIDSQDRIYVADSYNQRIQIFEYLGGEDGG